MKYELTLTLKPCMYSLSALEQFRITKDLLLGVLQPYDEVSAIGELTSEHNVHYHCLIELPTILDKDKLLNRFRSLTKIFGRKTCNQVMFDDSYRIYMKKDIEETKKIIGDPVIRDFYGVARTIFI